MMSTIASSPEPGGRVGVAVLTTERKYQRGGDVNNRETIHNQLNIRRFMIQFHKYCFLMSLHHGLM